MPDVLDSVNHEAEANAKDWPAYPMRKPSGQQHQGMSWERPPLQEPTVEVLHSNERPNLTAVFGTTLPPQGLSGALRRYAFRFSESNGLHWVLLMVADRIDMFEGVADDLKHGHVPNLWVETGLRAELKYNPKGFAIKAGVTAVAAVGLLMLMNRSKAGHKHHRHQRKAHGRHARRH